MTVRTKFCVVGTGAGGGLLAYRLALSGADTIVVNTGTVPPQSIFQNELSPEGKGDFEIRRDTTFPVRPEVASRDALMVDDDGNSAISLGSETFRHYQIHHVNGLQNLWNGVCLRNSVEDFSNLRSSDASCRWPISYQDLEQHYSNAEQLACVVGASDRFEQFPAGSYAEPRAFRQPDRLFIEKNARVFGSDIFYFANRKAVDMRPESPQRCVACGNCSRGCRSASVYKFSTHLLPRIQGRFNFRLLDRMRLVRLSAGKGVGGQRDSAIQELVLLDEQTGGTFSIQAEAVILCAGAIETARILLNSFTGTAIRTDQIGVYLQDHPTVAIGTSLMHLWFKPISDLDRGYGDHLLVGGHLSDDQGSTPFVGQLWSNFMRIPYYLADLQLLPRFLREAVARQIYKSTALLFMFSPSVPLRNNCIDLTDKLDRYGQRQVNIHYHSASQEVENSLRLARLGRKMLRNAGGHFSSIIPSPPGTGKHYAGVCRMGSDPDTGAVDRDLKFFGIRNLYVCDGGVIPQLSEKHSSLTVMALADRLADHLITTFC